MRRVIIVIGVLAIVLISVVACNGNGADVKTPVIAFSAVATVTENECKYVCQVNSTSNEVASVVILKPETLNGITYKWLGDSYCIEYKDLYCESNVEYLPKTSFASVLIDVLKQSENAKNLEFLEIQSEEVLYKGTTKVGDFKLKCNKNSGLINTITVERIGLKVEFSKQKMIVV